MKLAILTTATDARKLQQADDVAAKLPWRGVFIDGSPAPEGWGQTDHLYDVAKHPSKEEYAYPVQDDAAAKAKPGDAIKSAQIVDALDATWAAVAEAPKEGPIEGDEKPVDDFAVPVK